VRLLARQQEHVRLNSRWFRLLFGRTISGPHGSIGGFDSPRKASGIHEWGALHPLPEGCAERGEARYVRGQGGGDSDIFIRCSCDQFGQAEVGQLREACAADDSGADERDDGDAHPI